MYNLATDTFVAKDPILLDCSWLTDARRSMFSPRLLRTMWQTSGSFTDGQQKWQGKTGSMHANSDESWRHWSGRGGGREGARMRLSRTQWCDLLVVFLLPIAWRVSSLWELQVKSRRMLMTRPPPCTSAVLPYGACQRVLAL